VRCVEGLCWWVGGNGLVVANLRGGLRVGVDGCDDVVVLSQDVL